MFDFNNELKEAFDVRLNELSGINLKECKFEITACGCYGVCRNSCGESCYQK